MWCYLFADIHLHRRGRAVTTHGDSRPLRCEIFSGGSIERRLPYTVSGYRPYTVKRYAGALRCRRQGGISIPQAYEMPDGGGGEGEQHFRTDLHATRPHEAQSMRAHSSLVVSVGSADVQGRSSAHVLTDRAPVQLLICVSRLLRLQAYITKYTRRAQSNTHDRAYPQKKV